MANPRQRRKAKSAAHKPVSHSKRAKRLLKKMPAICGPKALQDAWDPSKTVRQNYQALGLQHDLNPISSGGSEFSVNRTTACQPHTTSPFSVSERPALPKGFGRIVRDSSGNVVRVEFPDNEEVQEPEINAPVATTESELRIWANDRPEIRRSAGMKDRIIQDLEKLAASASVRERYTPLGERLYLQRLVNKYGDELEKMARDRRLNPEQRTANELKRAVSRAGGLEALSRGAATPVTE